jgi:hypothetical protein
VEDLLYGSTGDRATNSKELFPDFNALSENREFRATVAKSSVLLTMNFLRMQIIYTMLIFHNSTFQIEITE